jgi:hypothetical protein
MLYPDLQDVSIDTFGGYCPALPDAALPTGAASLAQDVAFPMGAVRSRGGLQNLAFLGARPAAGASINGLKTYLTPSGSHELMIWDSLGEMFFENPDGTLNLINSRPYTGLFYESQTLFGREYQAFFNSLGGFDIPRQWDGTNWDRVSQVGPGVAPQVTNFSPATTVIANAGGGSINIVGSPNGITFVLHFRQPNPPFYNIYYVTVNTTTPHGLNVNSITTLSGSTSTPNVNGAHSVLSVNSPTSFTFIFAQASGVTVNGGGGTVTGLSTSASLVRSAGVVTAQTSTPHNFAVGWQVQISGIANTTIGGGIAAVTRSGAGIVTVTTTTPHGLVANSLVAIVGVTNPDTSFNGTFTVATVPSPTTFTYAQAGTAESSGAGTGNVQDIWNTTAIILSIPTTQSFTYLQVGPDDSTTATGGASIVGQIVAGLHNVSVAFITRQGFITKPAPWAQFNAGGSQLGLVGNIATGPPNIQARLLLFTPTITPPATTGSFYSITSTMLIPDNTTTSAIVDFSDQVLISSFQADFLFTQLELGESAFMLPYNSRTAWLGERNKVQNMVNLTFDGGFGVVPPTGLPNGWTLDPTNGAGGSSAVANGIIPDWGDAYLITGDGATAIRGKITQSAFQDQLGVAIINSNTKYSVRARVRSGGGLSTGVLHINLQSTSGAFTTFGIVLPAASLTGNFQEFTAILTDPLPTPPTDLTLQVYADGTPTNGGGFIVDSIEVFPTGTPYNSSTARISHAFNPESFDGTLSQVQVRPGDGQQLRAGFPLRNNLYLAKDHYLCYVTDDGTNEPASWAVNEVSATVGICGPNAVDWNEEWAVFAERTGLWMCWGSDPVKITQEIQYDSSRTGKLSWASIDWTLGHTVWVRIDKINKMILVGVPLLGGGRTTFMLDYAWLEAAQDTASSPMVTYSAFTGKMLAHGRGRRWAVWNIQANSMWFAERNDGSSVPIFGNSVGNRKVYQQLDCSIQPNDDGVVVNGLWRSAGSPTSMEEQAMQFGAHRKLCGYMKFRAIGVGTLNLAISTTLRTTNLRNYSLQGVGTGYGVGGYGIGGYGGLGGPTGDGERPVNTHGERFYPQVGTSDVNSWFQLERLVLCIKKDATMPVRGITA